MSYKATVTSQLAYQRASRLFKPSRAKVTSPASQLRKKVTRPTEGERELDHACTYLTKDDGVQS